MHHPTERITHTTAFVTPVVKHWLEREIVQWVHHEGSIRRPIRRPDDTFCVHYTGPYPDQNPEVGGGGGGGVVLFYKHICDYSVQQINTLIKTIKI